MSFLRKLIKYGYGFMIDNIVSKVFFLFPVRNTIFFESVPNCGDSPKTVFDLLVSRGYNKKYKLVWWLYDENYKPEKIENVSYLDSKKHRLIRRYYEYTSKCLICCNRFVESHRKKQKSFYICHGSPLKQVEGYYHLPDKIDYYFGASEHFSEELTRQLSANREKEIDLGLPRNDAFAKKEVDLKPFFHCDYEKIVVWYPTFRQHKTGVHTGCSNAFPIIYDAQTAEELNRYAKEQGILIVIKPHFAQDLSMFSTVDMSNIVFINDEFFINHNISSYCFINSCDALVSDYSSIYYDYLLSNKPIALVWEDIEEYRRNPGFSVDIDFYCKGAEKIYDLADMKRFLKQVSEEKDNLAQERREICSLVNYSDDGQNAERVANKIIELAKL